jgi:hypothetical protein
MLNSRLYEFKDALGNRIVTIDGRSVWKIDDHGIIGRTGWITTKERSPRIDAS